MTELQRKSFTMYDNGSAFIEEYCTVKEYIAEELKVEAIYEGERMVQCSARLSTGINSAKYFNTIRFKERVLRLTQVTKFAKDSFEPHERIFLYIIDSNDGEGYEITTVVDEQTEKLFCDLDDIKHKITVIRSYISMSPEEKLPIREKLQSKRYTRLSRAGIRSLTLYDLRDRFNLLQTTFPEAIQRALISVFDEAQSDLTKDSIRAVMKIDTFMGIDDTCPDEVSLTKAELASELKKSFYGMDHIIDSVANSVIAAKHKEKPGDAFCFSGPPGVGKTQLAKKLAKVLNIPFLQIDLATKGVVEVLGTSSNFEASNAGELAKGLRRVGTSRAVLLLDEAEKIYTGTSENGNISEILTTMLSPGDLFFTDNFLGSSLPIDVSPTIIIMTTNSIAPLPRHIVDRLNIVEFKAYTVEEKIAISRLALKNLAELYKLNENDIKIDDDTLEFLISGYSNEAGIRQTERNFKKLINAIIAEQMARPYTITKGFIETVIGEPLLAEDLPKSSVGTAVAVGVDTNTGSGHLFAVQAAVTGKENTITGSAGTVLQESVNVAKTVLSTRYPEFDTDGLHLHLSNLSLPKDGPSAGTAIFMSLMSLVLNKQIGKFAFTGELDIFGNVSKIGGAEIKAEVCKRNGYTLVMPHENYASIGDRLRPYCIPVKTVDDLINLVF